MGLHRLTTATVGVPNVAETASFYEEFGLSRLGPNRLGTCDGGEQLRLEHAERRRLLRLGIGADHPDDLERIASDVEQIGFPVDRFDDRIEVADPGTGVQVVVEIAQRIVARGAADAPTLNGPGRAKRPNGRSAGLLRDGPVKPHKLGHVVVGSTDSVRSHRLFVEGLGFKVSDQIEGLASFLRCSTDHHNVLLQEAPIQFLHHTSWEVDDVDEIGRGARALLDRDPSRTVWGPGRHHIGSNFFWYLRDPAGNFAEYYADLDVIVDDELWQPESFNDRRALFAWGPDVPDEFLLPNDLADLIVGA